MKTAGTAPRPSLMSAEDFVTAFGDVYEHSPWVAEAAHAQPLDASADTAEGLSARMAAVVSQAPEEKQLELLRAHPDLAGKLAQAGDLTAASVDEQAGAGLDQCSAEELAKFQTLNATYTAKFGFPFIIAVRDLDRGAILRQFEQRLNNSPAAEFAEALRQVDRIAYLRLRQRLPGAGG